MKKIFPISLTVFFPTFNEEANIVQTITQTIYILQHSPYIRNYEVLIIDDGSTDDTPLLAEKLSKRYSHVKVVTHQRNLGYGATLKTGLAHATKEYIFFTDADLQFDITELQNLLVHLPTYDSVIGYRAPRRDPFMRLVNARGWNILNRILFGLRIRDIDCAFKLFKHDIIQRIHLESNGAMINAEILIRLRQLRVPIKEVPVSHMPRTRGSPTGAKPSVIVRALKEMLALYRGDLGSTTHKQALKFMAVGIFNTMLDATVYILLTRSTETFANHLLFAKAFSFFAGTVSSFMLNRYWTFGMHSRPALAEILRFYTVVSISMFINVAGMSILLSLKTYDLIALVATTVLTFAVGFSLSKLWVFGQKNKRSRPDSPIHSIRA